MDDIEITLENMPQPFTVYDADGNPVYRDAISYADRHGKTTAELKAIAQQRYENYLAVLNAPAQPEDIPPEEPEVPEEG